MVFQQSSTTFRIRHVEFLIDLQHSINRKGCSLGGSVFLFLLTRNLKCYVASVIESKYNCPLVDIKLNNSSSFIVFESDNVANTSAAIKRIVNTFREPIKQYVGILQSLQ